MERGNDAYARELKLWPVGVDIYSPEWMIQPVAKPADTSTIADGERRMRVDRRRAERRHKPSE
jgi:hypothetical protein